MAFHFSNQIRTAFRTNSAAVILITVLAVAGCGGKADTATRNPKDVSCTVGSARLTTVPQYVTATGSLEADKSVMVSTRMMGWVKKLHVIEGQAVKQGDLLISIDDTDLRARKAQATAGIAAAEAVLANAEKMATRFENLYAEKSVSKAQLDDVLTGRDQAAAGVKMARAGLTEVNVHLSYLDIAAPCDGVVGRKMIEEGDMANPGMPLLILEQTDLVKVVAHLGEKDISSVKVGDTVLVNVSSVAGAEYETQLDRVIPTANPGSRTYDIEATLDNSAGRLRSGMFARVKVPVAERQAVLIPAEALIRRGQLTGVWIVDDNSFAHLRWVRLGHKQGDQLEVLSGLAGNETLVLSSRTPLAEGDKVVK
jgi:RND family efflux transporter MFP subunit